MKMFRRLAMAAALAALLALTAAPAAQAETGVTEDTILMGTFQDLSGPLNYLGKLGTAVLNVWVHYVNDELGGIHGRKIKLVVEDNKYDPVLTKNAYNKLVHQDKVFMIVSVYGSTPCTAILEDIKKDKVPVFTTAAATESMFDPINPYMFWYAANGQDEGILMVDYVVNKLNAKNAKIGICYQDDEWGKDALEGVELACEVYDLKYAEAPFKRGSKNFNTQAMRLKAKGVTHCLYVGPDTGYSSLLEEANKIGWKPVFFGDYVSVHPRIFTNPELADGHYHIWSFGLPQETGPGREKMERLFTEAGAEKILNVPLLPILWNPLMLLTEALEQAGPDLTREKLIATIEDIGEFDTGGQGTIGFGPDSRKGTKYYRILEADAENQRFVPVTDWIEPSIVWGSELRPPESE